MATKAAGTYIETVGRRKTAAARARITKADKISVVVNDKPLEAYFQTEVLQNTVMAPLKHEGVSPFSVSVHVVGGGIAGQATAVRHAISRALVENDETLRTELKKLGFLKRDPRAKERRKFGLKKARKAPQWSKR
ncbi:MAG TPA: 30S ribosomal protein S9 [Candidatus Paceibacterota bacterium]